MTIEELRSSEFAFVLPLFEGLRYHLASAAVLDGTSPGRVLVDDRERPRTAFMISPEGCYLAGDPRNRAFCRAFNRSIVREGSLGDQLRVLFLVVQSEAWRDKLPSLFAPHAPLAMRRRHYVCGEVRYDWRARLPEGYTVRRIDRSLLDSPRVTVPDHVARWVSCNWGTESAFLRHGFGVATVTDDAVVSWSLADCVSGSACEIGIRTAPGYRRRGLATITAAAAAEHALTNGFATVGWHCPEDNVGSIGTAEKVGFQLEREYVAYYADLDE